MDLAGDRAGDPADAPYGALAAIQIGTPGPYQKASALLITDKGEGLALAKIALVPGADAMVVSEAGWLRLLETEKRLAGEVPQLLVFNKLDALDADHRPHALADEMEIDGQRVPRLFLSAHSGEGLPALRELLAQRAAQAAAQDEGMPPAEHTELQGATH